MSSDIGAYDQVNHIIRAAIPGPGFAPGVTKDGGMFKTWFSDWRNVPEPRFPPADEPEDQQPRSELELQPPNMMAQTLWPHNVPFGYPFRRMQFDEGVTYVKTGGMNTLMQLAESERDQTFWAVLAGIVIIALIIARS
ncbi:hypothetical protein EBT31_05365 [bacterium]|nr:hypothetical protein [bacterium]